MTLSEKLENTCWSNDYPGFVANRILMPMINEAIETLYNKVAGVYEIDTVMKLEWDTQWDHYNWFDWFRCTSILNVMYDGLKPCPCPLLVNMVRWKIRS
jgi:3-hydroxybutyryl-CoA dehydrogenase